MNKIKMIFILFISFLLSVVACNKYDYETGEVTFNPDEQQDSTTLINLAAGKFYRANVPASKDFPDIYPVEPWSMGSKLTDEDTGKTSPKDNIVAWTNQTVEIVLDLGSVQTVEEVAMHAIADQLFSMKMPANASVSLSKDGVDWHDIADEFEFNSTIPTEDVWSSIKIDKVDGRYVKFKLVPQSNATIALDEIKVLGEYKTDPKYVPKKGAYHGAFCPLYGFDLDDREGVTDNNAVVLYEKRVEKQLSLMLWYQKMARGRNFAEMQDVRQKYWGKNFDGKQRIFIFGWANDEIKSVDIATGKMDDFFISYFKEVASEEAKALGPVWFRPMNEMNGSWTGYYGDTKNYVRAWRRMYNIAEQLGVTKYNVFVWSPSTMELPERHDNVMKNYYPGDNYVDWLGVSCYPPSSSTLYPEDSRYVIAQMANIHNISKDKPIMITEGGYSTTTDHLRWVKEWFGIKDVYPRVKGVIWENHYDRRIHTEPGSLELYKELVKDPYWLDYIPQEVLEEMERRK